MPVNYPKVAVLLAAYNGEQWIEEQLASILRQSAVELTVYISIDPSSDGTEALCCAICAEHPSVIVLPAAGVFGGASRNFFRLIRDVDFDCFDFVAFADQDDVWHSNKLQRALQAIETHRADAYSSNVTAFWPDGRTHLLDKAQPQVEWDFLFEAAGPGCTYVMSRKLVDSLKASMLSHWQLLQNVSLHDWYCYAFARSKGFRWYIDPVPSMDYRQHERNQVGANKGLSSLIDRYRTIHDGWWFNQVRLIARLVGLGSDSFVRTWLSFRRLQLLTLSFSAWRCRRRLRDKVFFLFCLLDDCFDRTENQMTAPKVLVTGASGFVGEAVVLKLLVDKKFSPIAAVRGASRLHGLCPAVAFDLTHTVLPDLGDVQVVIHAAARVHVMNETCVDALIEFRKVNVEGTLRLARHAVQSGVKRFIFISSIKVNGESTIVGQPFTADDQPRPLDPYAISKFEAEEALMQIGQSTGMEVVIIRPPLVYGPGVKANFLSLLSLANTGIPLPLGAIRNQRSLVAIGNLVSFVVTCIDHPRAVNQRFLVSDGQDLSTTQLLQRLSKALGKRVWLLPIPERLLKLAAFILGKQAVVQRLCGSLQLDIAKNRELLAWVPPVRMHLAMRRTASHFLEKQT